MLKKIVINTPTSKAFFAELRAAAQEIGDKYGVTVDIGGATFHELYSCTDKATLKVCITDKMSPAEKFAADLNADWEAQVFGVKASDYGRHISPINEPGKVFKIIGIRSHKRHSSRVLDLLDESTGKIWNYPNEMLGYGQNDANHPNFVD